MPQSIENFPQSIIALLLSDYHVPFTQMQDILINDQFYSCIRVIIADRNTSTAVKSISTLYLTGKCTFVIQS